MSVKCNKRGVYVIFTRMPHAHITVLPSHLSKMQMRGKAIHPMHSTALAGIVFLRSDIEGFVTPMHARAALKCLGATLIVLSRVIKNLI